MLSEATMSVEERIHRMHSREKMLEKRIEELLKENTELRDQVETLTVQVEGWQKQVERLKQKEPKFTFERHKYHD